METTLNDRHGLDVAHVADYTGNSIYTRRRHGVSVTRLHAGDAESRLWTETIVDRSAYAPRHSRLEAYSLGHPKFPGRNNHVGEYLGRYRDHSSVCRLL
jgi:hypothetical protein